MDKYIVLRVNCEPAVAELLIAELANASFEGFMENDTGFEGYLPISLYDEAAVTAIFDEYGILPSEVEKEVMEQQNWNAQWESSFEPVVISEQLIIKAPFHELEKQYPYVLTIQPKTSFGTGHHETTSLILRLMLQMNFENQYVFDYGSGTGILAIMASKLGATDIFANDIDDWAAENIFENAALNKVDNIHFEQGNLELAQGKQFDVILANINKNILMGSFEALAKLIKPGGPLLISGFYESDLDDLLNEANKHGLQLLGKEVLNNWCAAKLVKG